MSREAELQIGLLARTDQHREVGVDARELDALDLVRPDGERSLDSPGAFLVGASDLGITGEQLLVELQFGLECEVLAGADFGLDVSSGQLLDQEVHLTLDLEPLLDRGRQHQCASGHLQRARHLERPGGDQCL